MIESFVFIPGRFLVAKRLFSVLVCLLLLLSTARAQTAFKDQTKAVGLALGGPACWADFNNDGWVDICSGGVWINDKGKSFKKIDGTGSAIAADFDNDGFIDLFSYSSLQVLRNIDGKSFKPIKMPKLPKCQSRGACWGDFNGDGFVDLFIGGYEVWSTQTTFPFLVLLNEKGKSFKLVREESLFRARGVTACDFDRDGDLDVYVSNYRLQPNLLWVNDGKGNFKELAGKHNAVATSAGFGGGHSIGAAWGDFNNVGLIDLFAGNFAHVDGRGNQPKSRFLKNLGKKKGYTFQDMGPCGVHYQESYASPSVGDFDNDGNLDLFFTTVYGTASFGRPNQSVLFRNDGKFKVTNVTSQVKIPRLPPTYQSAWADYDNDGDLDFASAGRLFQNQGNKNSWLRVRLHGDGKSINRAAIGAQVRVFAAAKIHTRQVEAGTGEGNQNDLTLHVGLGAHSGDVKVEIFWPNKKTKTISGVKTRKLLVIKY